MTFLYVQAYYGPCDSFGSIVMHKPQFLYGLRDKLKKLGFRVDLRPVEYINYCMIELCGHEVFRCNIKQLHFNTASSRDVVCQRAIDAVMQASVKFQGVSTYFWFRSYLDQELFDRGEGTIPHYWAKDVKKVKSYIELKKCIKCCNLSVKTKSGKDKKP